MRFEAFVAIRYLRGKRKNRFVSLITLISVAGVSVGVIALIIVMSVMTGFDIGLRNTIIGNRSHLAISDPDGGVILDPDTVIREIKNLCPEIVAASPYIEVLGLIKTEATPEAVPPSQQGTPAGKVTAEFPVTQQYAGCQIVGVDVERETAVTQIADNLTNKHGRVFGYGELPGYKEIMLGYRLANQLRVVPGSRVGIITPGSVATPLGSHPRVLWVTVSGISESQMSEFDTWYGFTDIRTAQQLKGYTRGVDGIHCKLTNPDLASTVAERIRKKLGFATQTWYQSQQAFFEALVQEKVVMFIILVFIILVATFNITSTLIMVVMEKRRDIGILRTLGLSTGAVLRLFILEGLYVGIGGTLIGLFLGTFLALYLNPVANLIAGWLGIDLFNSQIYYFDRIPVPGGLLHFYVGWAESGGTFLRFLEVNWHEIYEGIRKFYAIMWHDIAWIGCCSVVLTFLSTLYPAWSAARVDPVDALRHE